MTVLSKRCVMNEDIVRRLADTNTVTGTRNRNASDTPPIPLWKVVGQTPYGHITTRFHAANKDVAMKEAHDRGIRVATCERVDFVISNSQPQT